MMGHGYNYGGMEWMWVPMLIWTALVVAGLVVLTIVIVRLLRGEGGHAKGSSAASALEILNERFARGEIEEDEYRRRRETLK
ncbi:SHOCT domain-containing protein [Arthrobacter sp. A2-55]|uniref:SHOCT domain-containing protein n=1 Tax=Arthrobacter sp. A2-55 TaxID=2897337 RepID=UPI0021CD196B|nr:SHOCT domain-containing protein [Arthrobacter sp. A2-55]MCU6481807.1 SHOCT domain-containing protein [Arthrobacter sp. A2-55]